jgi:hypothetical protein
MRLTVALFAFAGLVGQTAPPIAPLVDHHQHLFSAPAVALAPGAPGIETIDAGHLIALLDAAGIQRAAILSVAYQYANPNRPPVVDEHAKVRAENDWTSAQAARFPDRLRGLCGVNPLEDHGSDGATGGGLTPKDAWAAFRKLPLTDAEFRTIATNVAPYMK